MTMPRSPRLPGEPRRSSGKRSPYTGVYFDESRKEKPWEALIQHQGKTLYVGRFATDEEAALAWNEEARRLRGRNARVNTVPMRVRYSSARAMEKSSRYMGVKRPPRCRLWQATIYDADAKGIYLGSFETEEEAALAWNAKAVELRGPNTKLNQIGKSDGRNQNPSL